MPHWLLAILLGVVEGVTEFLPVSSTGHLLLVESALGRGPFESEAHFVLFNTVVQGGAVLAVLAVFRRRAMELASGWRGGGARDYLLKLAAAFALTVAGMLAAKAAGWKLPKEAAPVAWATLIGGVIFIGAEWRLRGRVTTAEITWGIALAAGAAQVVAGVFPGTSRSGATILVALLLGVARPAAAEFSFLLGVPTLLAAGGYEVLSLLRKGQATDAPWGHVALGTAAATLTAFVVVRWLLRFVQNNTFVAFGWYRVVMGALVLLLGR